MRWPAFHSPYIKVECPDGPRFILRKPEKAFSILAPDWQARIKTIIKAYEACEANLEAEVKREVKPIIEGLGRNYAELQAHYQAAYLQFCTNPCDKGTNGNLARANEEIRRMEYKLREIEVQTEVFLQRARGIELREPKKIELRRELTVRPSKRPKKMIKVALEPDLALLADIKKLVSEFRHSTV